MRRIEITKKKKRRQRQEACKEIGARERELVSVPLSGGIYSSLSFFLLFVLGRLCEFFYFSFLLRGFT